MATCNPAIDAYQSEDGTLDVSEKYTQLMQDTLADDSLYMRAKDTMYQQFDKLNITAPEKAKLVSEHVATMTTNLSSVAMQSAIQWSKEERDGAYTLAKIKADTELALANFELVKVNICKAEKEEDLICAQVMKTSADSIRANGYVLEYEADGCRVKHLDETGLVFNQTKQVQGATYQTYADAYRKSGVVSIGTESTPIINPDWVDDGLQSDPDQSGNPKWLYVTDGYTKGLSGDEAGYTHQQEQNAERQRLAYEDSKRTQVANSASAMIGQMLSAEVAPKEQDVQRWRDAVDFLNRCDPSTTTANCAAIIPPVEP